LFQVSGPVGDQSEGFGDGLRQNGVHHEFLAVGGNSKRSAGTGNGGGLEQGVGCAQFQAGAFWLTSTAIICWSVEKKKSSLLPFRQFGLVPPAVDTCQRPAPLGKGWT
jgi:hypothetical protein